MHTTFKEDIMRALIYRKLNLDLLDWDNYGSIISVSKTADGGHANITLDVTRFRNYIVCLTVPTLVEFLDGKGWAVSYEGDTITVTLELPSPGTSDTEKRTYAETGDYDREETEDA